MEALFWTLVLLTAYSYLGYPLVVFVLSLFIHHPVQWGPGEPGVTFLITAYNEERSLRAKLMNTLALDYPRDRLEIIVASDASTDRTDAIAREFAARGVKLVAMPGRVGKTEAQNRAVSAAHGDILIFSDATTKYERSAVRKIVRNYADPRVGAVGGRFRYSDPDATHIGKGTSAFWDYESFIKGRQTRIGTITGASGCIYSVRRALYEPLPFDIISDLVEPLKIIEKGYRVVYEKEALAYEDSFKRSHDEFRMRIRVISRGMHGLLFMRKLLNPFRHPFISFQLVSHKVLRWLVPFFAILLYALSALLAGEGKFYLACFSLQTLFYAAAGVGLLGERSRHRVRLLSLPLYFCIINTASLVALFRLVRRKKEIVWETVRQ